VVDLQSDKERMMETLVAETLEQTQPAIEHNGWHPIPPLQSGDRLTRAEFERRYHLHPEIKKAELIEGVVYVASPVHAKKHASPHFNVIGWLSAYAAVTPGAEGNDNATLLLDLENEPQPDIILCLDPSYGGQTYVTADDYLEGTPELIVEIAASSASYDLNPKKRAYARNGVREYLVFVSYERRTCWFVLRDEGYVELKPDAEGILRSEVFPGLWLPADALWQGDLPRMLAVLQQGLASAEHAQFVEHLQAHRQAAG
jgi:Uma2 family endonuclease